MGSCCEILPSPFGLLTQVLQGSWLTPLNGGLAGMRSGVLQPSFWADDCSCSVAHLNWEGVGISHRTTELVRLEGTTEVIV